MGTLTDRIRQAGRESAIPSEAGMGVGYVNEREKAIIDRHKQSVAGRGSLFQKAAQGRAEIEIAARQQQRAYAEKPQSTLAQITVDPAREMVENLGDRAKVLDTLRKLSPEQREEALRLAPGIAQQLGDDRGGAVGRTLGALSRGVSSISQPAMELAGKLTGTDWGGTPEEIAFIRQLEGAASQEFAPALPSDPWYERFPLQAAEMVPFSAATVGGGVVGGAIAKKGAQLLARGAAAGVPGANAALQTAGAVGRLPSAIGLPAATAQGVGTVAGITTVGFPGQYAQEIDQLKELGVEDGPGMQSLAVGTALASSALEAIMPNPFPAGGIDLKKGAITAARQYLWEAAKRAPGEISEEYAQGLASGLGKTVASYLDMTTKDVTLGDAFATSFEQGNAAIGPMAFLLGVPALAGAGAVGLRARGGTPPGPPPVTQAPPPAGQSDVASDVMLPGQQVVVEPPTTVQNQVVPPDQSQRLARLQEIRAKGPVSRKDGIELGIKGNQDERTAIVDAEIGQLSGMLPTSLPQGVPGASQVRTNEALDDVQGDGREGSQVDSGGEIRVEGQVEEGAKPTSEVAATQEVPVAPPSDWKGVQRGGKVWLSGADAVGAELNDVDGGEAELLDILPTGELLVKQSKGRRFLVSAEQASERPPQKTDVAQPPVSSIRKGRDEEYGRDIELERTNSGYVLRASDEHSRDLEISSGSGGIYLNDLILNQEGEFVKSRQVVQAGNAGAEAKPFKPDLAKKQEVIDLVAEIEFQRAVGADVTELEDALRRIASGMPERATGAVPVSGVAQPPVTPAPQQTEAATEEPAQEGGRWIEVPNDAVLEPGKEIRLDIEKGKTYVWEPTQEVTPEPKKRKGRTDEPGQILRDKDKARIAEIDKELASLQSQYEKKSKQQSKSAMVPPSIKADALSQITKKMDKLDAEKKALLASPEPTGEQDTGTERELSGNRTGTEQPEAGVPTTTAEQPDRVQQIQDTFQVNREVAIVADILADATSPPGEVKIALPGTPIPDAETLFQKQRDQQGDIQAWTHFVNASKAIIGATDKADVSSFFHEWAHPLRRFLFNREVSQEERGNITDDDILKIEEFVGVKDGNWTRENEEGFVDALMSYWMEGKAPTPELETVFQKISAWLSKVISVIQRQVPLNDEVRAIFDKVHRRGGVDPKKLQALKEAEVSAEAYVEPAPSEAVDDSLDDFFDDIAPSDARVEAVEKLETAGIKIKQTKKGWSVTGLPDNLSQGIHDGIKAEGGRRTGYGYLFKDNPTNRLVPTAEAITDAIRQADEAAAAGMVSTPIGVYSQEDADWYRETRKQRLELAKQQLNVENAAVDELLSQFVGNRGVFKKQLLAAAENSDPNAIEGFGKLLDYSVDHPELGLPQTENGLFQRLLKTVVQEKDLEKQIDEELAAELAAEEGDDSFDFGEPEAAQPKQTAIEGLEDDVARQERKDIHDAKRAKFKEKLEGESSKGKQRTFLTDIYGDADQGTLFDTDGIADNDPDTLFQATESPERLAARMLRSAIDAGVKTFEDYITHAKNQGLRDDQILENASTMKLTWDRLRVRNGFTHLPPAGRVADALAEKPEPAKPEKPKEKTKQKPKQPEKPAEKPTSRFFPRVPGVRKPGAPFPEVEPEPYEPHELTGMAKAVMNDLRELAGIPELEAAPPETIEQWALDAQSTMAADPHAATRLLNDIIANPARALDHHDVMLLAFRYRALVNEAEPHFQEVVDANASGDAERIAKARTNYILARQPVTEFEELTLKAKSTWGRTGIALQVLLRRDNTVAGLLRRAREANHGNPLNEKQEIEMRDLAKRFADIQKKLDEETARADKAEAEVASLRHLKELVKESPTRKKPSKEQKSELDKAWGAFAKLANVDLLFQRDATNPTHNIVQVYRDLGVETFAELRRHIQERLGKEQADKQVDKFKEAWEATKPETEVPANIDRGNLAQLTREARRIERSIVEGLMLDHSTEAVLEMRDEIVNAVHAEMQELLDESFTHRQTMDALSGYGQFSRPSQDTTDTLLRNLNAEVLKLRQIDQLGDAVARVDQLRANNKDITDAEIADILIKEGLLVAQTGLVRDTPSDRLRDLNRQYNEKKKDIPASSEGRAGLLQTAVAAIERGLANRIRDLNHAINKQEPIKIGRKEPLTNPKIEQLKEERDALLKEYRKLFPAEKKKLTPEQRLANAIKAAERSIEVLEKQIATRNFDKQEQEALPESPELTELRERLEHLRDQRNVAKALELSQWENEGGAVGPDPKEAAYRKAYIASLSNRIAKLQQFLREGDFSPQEKKLPRILSKEELDLKSQLAKLNTEKLKKMADYHLAHLKGIAWTADKVSEVLHLARAVETMADLSSLGRQGGLIALGHPALAKNALVGVIKSMAQAFDKSAIFNKQDLKLSELEQFLTGIDSRKAELAFMHQLTEGEWGEFRQLAELDLPSTDQAITRQEEAFQGRWGKYFPGVAISSRLYTMILNKMRADMFDLMVEKLGRQGKITLEEAKLIAHFVNVMTGRSDLKQFNSHAATLNNVFFAPRYVASRFQYLAMPFYLPFKGGVKANWQIKRAIYREYARTASGAVLTLGLIALAGHLFWDDDDEDKPTVGVDPTTSDFLKPKFGETRLDFLAGLQQVFVLSARMLPEELGGGRIGDKKYGEGGPYSQNRATVIARFLRTKLAPGPGYVVTGLNDWENVIGEKSDRVFGLKVHPAIGTTTNLFFPLSMQSVADAFETQPVPVAAGASILAILGVGMSTYGPKTEYMTGTPEERQKQIAGDLENLEWDAPDPSYSEFLTKEQLAQFEKRRANRVGLKLSQAISEPESELGKKARDKALELIKESKRLGRTRAEAIKAYTAYWQENNGKNGRKASTHEIVGGSLVMKAALRKGINKVKALYRD